jgi:predicted esterase
MEQWSRGRLTARANEREGDAGRLAAPWLYVPKRVREPAPLLLVLHGAGGRGARAMEYMRGYGDRYGAIVIAPDSIGHTWDVILGRLGPDVERIDAQLELVFDSYAVDENRIAVNGFSDGASYALTLGVTNGDLFTHIIAFSPGFMAPVAVEGKPRVFVSHGADDDILPIARCSRRLVPVLENAGYEVVYREFDGGHTVPGEIADEAMEWFLAG